VRVSQQRGCDLPSLLTQTNTTTTTLISRTRASIDAVSATMVLQAQ